MSDESYRAPIIPVRPSTLQNVLWIALIALLYFGLARLSLSLAFLPEGIPAIWPASGIFLSAILLTRRTLRPWLVGTLFITDFVAEMLAGTPLFVSFLYATILTCDALLSLWLLLRFVGEPITFNRLRELVGWLLLSVILSNALASLAAATTASLLLPGASFWNDWIRWMASDGIGNLIITPLILSWAVWARTQLKIPPPKRMVEGSVLVVLLALLIFIAFHLLTEYALFSLFLIYLTFPFLLWAALRFGVRGVASASVSMTAIAIYFTSSGHVTNILNLGSPLDVMITVQIFLAMIAVPALFLATVVTERYEAESAHLASQKLIHDITDNSTSLIYSLDLTGRFMLINHQLEKLLGVSQKELIGKAREAILPVEIAKIHRANDLQVITEQKPISFEEVNEEPDGRHTYLSVKFPLFDSHGALYGISGISTDITERKLAEAALQENKQRLASIYDTVGDVLFYLAIEPNKQYRFSSVNTAFCRVTGLLPEQVIGRNVTEVIPQPSLSMVLEKYRQAIEEKAIIHWEETSEYPTGRLIGEVSVAPVLDVSGNCTHLVGSVHDITARKQAEFLQDAIYRIAQAADQAESLESLFPSIHAIIQEVMPADNFYIALYDEKTDLLSFPYSVDEVDPPMEPKKPGKGLTEYVLRTAKSLLCDQALFDQLNQRGEIELVGGHSPIWLGVPLIIAGQAIGIMAVQNYRNINAYSERELRILEFVSSQAAMAIHRKQAEEELRESESSLETILRSTADGILAIGIDNKVLFANEHFTKLWRIPPAVIASNDDNAMLDYVLDQLSDPQSFLKKVQELYKSKDESLDTLSFKDGRVFERLSCPLMQGTELQGRVWSFRDITVRKKAEEEIRLLNADLEQRVVERTRELTDAQQRLVQQEKLAVLGQLAGAMGHELRNPLGVIQNAIFYLRLVQPEVSDKVKQYHDMIEQETHAAVNIIADLLDFARIKSTDRELVSVSEMIDHVLARNPAPPIMRVKFDFSMDLPLVFTDPSQIEQILANLVENAYQAMPEGGQLTIAAVRQRDGVVIAISDTGNGISPQNMDRLFEPLFTTKIKGIGLGLAVSKKLIEANHGRIEAHSQLGKGSTFTIYLPERN
jgi:PAS domain S-box-containing protein